MQINLKKLKCFTKCFTKGKYREEVNLLKALKVLIYKGLAEIAQRQSIIFPS